MNNINRKLARSSQGQWWLLVRAGKSVNGQPVFVREEGPFMTRKIAEIYLAKKKELKKHGVRYDDSKSA